MAGIWFLPCYPWSRCLFNHAIHELGKKKPRKRGRNHESQEIRKYELLEGICSLLTALQIKSQQFGRFVGSVLEGAFFAGGKKKAVAGLKGRRTCLNFRGKEDEKGRLVGCRHVER